MKFFQSKKNQFAAAALLTTAAVASGQYSTVAACFGWSAWALPIAFERGRSVKSQLAFLGVGLALFFVTSLVGALTFSHDMVKQDQAITEATNRASRAFLDNADKLGDMVFTQAVPYESIPYFGWRKETAEVKVTFSNPKKDADCVTFARIVEGERPVTITNCWIGSEGRFLRATR